VSAFIECTNKILRLHELIRDGNDEGEEGEALREEIDDLQRDMDWLEKDLSDCLCGDLYMLTEEDLYAKTHVVERQALLIRLLQAVGTKTRQNALVVLKLLRHNMGFPRHRIAEYRYYVWRCLNPKVGEAFGKYWEALPKD